MDKLCRIRDLERAVLRFEADFEAQFGLSLNDGMTLCTLAQRDKMCPGELGEALGLTASNMSKVLRGLETSGLVAREMCCKDRRQFFYSLTAEGRSRIATLDCNSIELPEPLRRWLEIK